MPLPFKPLGNTEVPEIAAFLKFVEEPEGKGLRGALFCVDARGDPVDFSFSRVDVNDSFLWRPGEARRRAVASLSKVLFEACPSKPALLLTLASEVGPRVFAEDIAVEVPLGRIAGDELAIQSPRESGEALADGTVHVFWSGESPPAESPPRRLLDALLAKGLVVEPFERAAKGIEEAFRRT